MRTSATPAQFLNTRGHEWVDLAPRHGYKVPSMYRTLIALCVLSSFAIPAAAQVEGRFGQAFQSADAYAAAPPNPVYTVMPLTVECWAKLSTKSAYNILVANEPKSSVTHWELYAEKGTGRLAAHLPAFTPNVVKSDDDVTDGQWHYLAMTCDGATLKLYVDAKEVASAKLA